MAVASERQAGSFLEQDSTTVPNFACRLILSCGNLVGLPPQARLLRLAPLEKIHPRKEVHSHEKIQHAPPKPGNQDTLDRGRYAEFSERVTLCKMSQAEFIRQALTKSRICPVITVSPVNDELLSAVGKLTAEYGKIGGNLNQIARCLNEYGAPYNTLSNEVRAAIAELPP